MTTPLSSLAAQIAAIERAHGYVPTCRALTEGQVLLEQKYLGDAIKTLEWISTHSDELREFFAARKASK